MVRIKLQDVFTVILIIPLLIGGIYGTYLFYWTPKPYTSLNNACVLMSILLQVMICLAIVMGIITLSEQTITINTNKIKQNLKQLIK